MKLSNLDTRIEGGLTLTPIRTALRWLSTTLKTDAFKWDDQQHEAATGALGDALAWLEQDPRVIHLTPAEIQSGHDRVKWAEDLILQLPATHEGRNSWLLNYAGGKNGATATEAAAFVPPPCTALEAVAAALAKQAGQSEHPPRVTPEMFATLQQNLDVIATAHNRRITIAEKYELEPQPSPVAQPHDAPFNRGRGDDIHAFCLPVTPCSAGGCHTDKLDPVRLAVQQLLDAAMSARVVVTIERRANTDGSSYYEIGTRSLREDYQVPGYEEKAGA